MIHHITAICADAQRTADFYVHVLGLRLVKVTVNQDDVGTYHLYFGDRVGKPGTVLTFFPWSALPHGSIGAGMVSAVQFAVPQGSLAYWEQRLLEFAIDVRASRRFGAPVLHCADPDGLPLELMESDAVSDWVATVPSEYAVSGFFGATLCVQSGTFTAKIVSELFGYVSVARDGAYERLRSPTSGVLDIRIESQTGEQGIGTVHHIAFRAADLAAEQALRSQVLASFLHPTPVIDRFYFSSVYFREPGGILFEIATDGPGFTIDEPEATLGTKLVLPPRFEPDRERITKLLPAFTFRS